MLEGFKIVKLPLNEGKIDGNTLFECNYSDYELYQILESCGYKTTNKNKDILKKGLKEGKYFIEDELDVLLQEEFKQFLNEEPIILGEELLNEGKILNKIRWKLALFSLRFLSNTSIDAFFIAYYADKKTGEATEKGKEFCKKSRKEKLAKMRELANGIKEEEKQKVINSQAARQAESSGIFSFIGAGIAGATAGVAAYGANMTKNAAAEASKGSEQQLDRSDTDVSLYQTQNVRVSDIDGTRDGVYTVNSDEYFPDLLGNKNNSRINGERIRTISSSGKGSTSNTVGGGTMTMDRRNDSNFDPNNLDTMLHDHRIFW